MDVGSTQKMNIVKAQVVESWCLIFVVQKNLGLPKHWKILKVHIVESWHLIFHIEMEQNKSGMKSDETGITRNQI